MGLRRNTVLKLDLASLTGTTTFALGAPGWAEQAILHVLATVAATGTLNAKVIQDNPDSAGTEIDVPGAAIDAIAAGATPTQRYLVLGAPTAIAGTSFDGVVVPLSRYQTVSVTQATAAVTNLKVWVEFIGR